jgi:hypothetical protein
MSHKAEFPRSTRHDAFSPILPLTLISPILSPHPNLTLLHVCRSRIPFLLDLLYDR